MTAELVAAARARVDRIKTFVGAATGELKESWRQRDWIPLGYPSWDAMCEAEFAGVRIALPVEERRELVADLRREGMSPHAIASAVGTSEPTVRRDLAGSSNDEPARPPVTGLDGKTYPPRPPRPVDDVPRDGIPARDPAIRDFIAASPDVRTANLRADFAKWIYAMNQAHLFDPDELAAIYAEREADVIRTRDALIDWTDRYIGTIRRSRMTVLDGGQE